MKNFLKAVKLIGVTVATRHVQFLRVGGGGCGSDVYQFICQWNLSVRYLSYFLRKKATSQGNQQTFS